MAFDKLVETVKTQGLEETVTRLAQDRLVEVEFEVKVPEATAEDATVFLTGNASAVGSWSPSGILLQRTEAQIYRGKALIPKGRFEFKVTKGSWDNVEVRTDGRSTSNRRQLLKQPVTIRAEVEAWKVKAKE